MARGRSVIVGGGVNAATPFTEGQFSVIVNDDPATIGPGNIRQVAGTPDAVFVGDSDGVVASTSCVIGSHTFDANASAAPVVIIGQSNRFGRGTAGLTNGVVLIGENQDCRAGAGAGTHAANVFIGFDNTLNDNASNVSSAILIGVSNTITAGANTPIMIGQTNSISFGAAAIIIGNTNNVTGNTGLAVMLGATHDNAGNQGVAVHIGSDCNCTSGLGVFVPIMIGQTVTVSGANASNPILIGQTITVSAANCNDAIVIGRGVTISGTSEGIVCIGGASATGGGITFNNRLGAIHLGIGPLADLGDGWCVIGNNQTNTAAGARIANLLLGGEDRSAATGFAIRFSNEAAVADQAAGNAVITAPLSTGNAAPGRIDLQTGVPGASSANVQAARTSAAVQASVTAGDTDLLVFDVDNATLERVTVGAAGSGGVGFKVLRIPD